MSSDKRRLNPLAAGLCLAGFLLAACAPQEPSGTVPADQQAARAWTWPELGKLPDFTTGIWEVPITPESFNLPPPSFTPPYAARAKAFADAEAAGSFQETGSASCIPPGVPANMANPYPIQIMFGPAEVMIHLEALMQVRHIYTDGRAHPEDPTPTFNGHSIGHWEGDTLVVESIGFVAETPLDPAWSLFHSDRMRVIERFRLTDPDSLEVVTTVEDPEAFTQPWVTTRVFKRHRDWTIAEYICQQNNRNGADAQGNAILDLTPPSLSRQ